MKQIPTQHKADLLSELPSQKYVIQNLIKPIGIFLIISFASIFVNSSLILNQEEQSLDDININNFTIQNVIDGINRMHHDISIYFSFAGIQNDININGGIFAACFQNGISVFNYTGQIPTFSISDRELIKVFRGSIIEYDTVNITMRFEQNPNFAHYFQIIWAYQNPHFIAFYHLLRLSSLIIIYPIVKYFYAKITTIKSISIKDILTFILLILGIGYIHPLSPLSIFLDRPIIEYIGIFLRDLFYSYLYFYFLSIFALIPSKSRIYKASPLLLLIIPYFFLLIAASLLLKTDFLCFYNDETIRILPELSNDQNYLSDWTNISPQHIKIFFFFCIIVLIYIIPCAKFYLSQQQSASSFIYYLAIFIFFTIPTMLNLAKQQQGRIPRDSCAFFSVVDYLVTLFTVIFCAYGQVIIDL